MNASDRLLLLLTALALLGGCVAALRLRARERALIGAVVEQSLLSPARRYAPVALIALLTLAAWLGLDGERSPADAAALFAPAVLSGVFLALRPGVHDRVAGTEGVRRGWYVRKLVELEEWRLTGEHLRFRLRGRWEAVPFAAERHEDLAERLRKTIPERESEFAA